MSGTITVNAVTISVLIAQTDDGFLSDRFIINEEEFVTAGVDGARWRTVTKQFPEFELRTVSQAASYGVAVDMKRDIEQKMVGRNANISVTINANNYSMKNAHIKAAKAAIVPGPVYASGVSGANAHVITQWIIKGTDFSAR